MINTIINNILKELFKGSFIYRAQFHKSLFASKTTDAKEDLIEKNLLNKKAVKRIKERSDEESALFHLIIKLFIWVTSGSPDPGGSLPFRNSQTRSGSPPAAQSPRTAPLLLPCWAGLESPNWSKPRPSSSVREPPTWSSPVRFSLPAGNDQRAAGSCLKPPPHLRLKSARDTCSHPVIG